MRRINFWLTLAILGGLLLAAPALAAVDTIKLKIVNNSRYPDKQIYLIAWGKSWAETTHHDIPYRLDLKTGALILCQLSDNTYSLPGYTDKYCQYWVTLDQIKQDDGSYSFTFPQVDSLRLYMSFNKPTYFHINDPTDIAPYITMREPSTTNNTDPSYATIFDKFEATYNAANVLYANTTNVDYTCLPLQFEIYNGTTRVGIRGFSCTQAALYQALAANPLLKNLRTPYRFYSPEVIDPTADPKFLPPVSFTADYWKPYVDYVWSTYWQTANSLEITETDLGGFTVQGQISGDVLTLTDKNDSSKVTTINKPTRDWDIFAGAGVFTPTGGAGGEQSILVNEICTAINRTVFHLPFNQWNDSNRDNYYKQNGLPDANYRTNIYSQILHPLAYGQFIYGYTGDAKYNQSSTLSAPGPNLATDLVLTINPCIRGNPAPEMLLLD